MSCFGRLNCDKGFFVILLNLRIVSPILKIVQTAIAVAALACGGSSLPAAPRVPVITARCLVPILI